MGKTGTRASLLHFANSHNVADLISVSKRIVFVRDNKTNSFYAKIQLVNQCPRFVSYKIRTSNKKKFSLYPKYGFIPPRRSLEVVVSTTKYVKGYPDISKESFCVFAVPIYDKRQLERKSLTVLWQAHGTDLFPYEHAERYPIPYVLPKNDTYFDDLPLIGRLGFMSHIFSLCNSDSKFKAQQQHQNERTKIDEETFYANWPSQKADRMDSSLNEIVSDWHTLAEKVHQQTQGIVDNTKVVLGTIFAGGTTVFGLGFLCFKGHINLLGNNNCCIDCNKVEEQDEGMWIWNWINPWKK